MNQTGLARCVIDAQHKRIMKNKTIDMTRAEELLDKYLTDFEWEMEIDPERLDKADYEFYYEVKEYFDKLKQ